MEKEAKRLHKLFSGLERAHGAYILNRPKPEKGKYTGQGITYAEPVSDELWQLHLVGQRGLGIVPIRDDGKVLFGAVDIDVYDLDVFLLSKRLAKMDLPLVLCKTKSGGAHLYLFLKHPIEAPFIRSLLGAWASELGYAGSEIFPKQNHLANEKDIGNWINMPYFAASKVTDRPAIYDGEELDLNTFINLADEMKVDREELQGFMYDEPEEFADGPPCLQTLSRRGFEEGSRNNALFDIGVYLKLRHGDDWESYFDSYNIQFIKPPLQHAEITQVLRNVRKSKAFYRCEQPPICNACNKVECKGRKFGIGTSENKDPGVTVDQITQIKGEAINWIMQVQGERIEVSTDEMLTFRLFKRKCVENLRLMPQPMRQDAWDRYLAPLIEGAEIVEVPEDVGEKGLFSHHLDQFLTSNAVSDMKEGLLRGKPYKSGSRIYFRWPDLHKYLDQQRYKVKVANHAWTWLREDYDAKKDQFNLKGRCVRVWSIRAPEEQDGEFDVPKIDVGEF